MAQAEETEREIDDTREQYRPVASHASLLFFAISEMAAIDPMYQYSLGWFLALFGRAMEEAPKVGVCECEGSGLLQACLVDSSWHADMSVRNAPI